MSSGSESDDENIFGDDGSGQEIDENILGELEQDLDRDGQPSDQDEVIRGLRLGYLGTNFNVGIRHRGL